MTEASSIFLLNNELTSNNGLSILPSNGTSISAISTISASGPLSSLLNISAWDRTQPNVLLNNAFQSGDTTSWVNSGCTVVAGDLPGFAYMCNCSNLNSIYQNVSSGFTNKNVVVTFWAKGNPLIISIETDDGGGSPTSSENRIVPQSDVWIEYTIGLYAKDTGGTQAKITFSSVWDNSYFSNVSMYSLDDFVQMSVGDSFNDSRSTLSVRGDKFFFGSSDELIGARSERFDIRSDVFIKNNLIVNGSIFSNVIYGPPGTLKFSTNLIFSSGSTTLLNWSSGIVQTIDTTSYGISSGSATISGLTYIFLDLNTSSSVLQTSTLYSDAIGNQKIFLGTAQNQSVGNVSFTSNSGQTPIVSGQSLTPSSVTFDKITVSSLSALNANMGVLTAGIISLGGAGSYLNFGVNPPISSSGSIGTAGLYQDYTGLYALSSTTLNASLTSNGLSAASGNFVADSTGVSLNILSSYSNATALTFKKSGVVEATLFAYDDGANPFAGFKIDTSLSTGSNTSAPAAMQLTSKSKTTYSSSIFMIAQSDGAEASTISLDSKSSLQSIVTINYGAADCDTLIGGSGSITNIAYFDASTGFIGIGTSNPLSRLHITNGVAGGTAGAVIRMDEVITTTPANPASDQLILYADDNGSGKTRLMVRFSTGAAIQLAIQV